MTLADGQQGYAIFIEECINTNEVCVWARMQWDSIEDVQTAKKSVKHKLDDQIVEHHRMCNEGLLRATHTQILQMKSYGFEMVLNC